MLQAIQELGYRTLVSIVGLGRFAHFSLALALALLRPPIRLWRHGQEVFNQGVLSLVIICVSGTAVGMVLGLQGYTTLVRFGAEQSLGAVVALTLLRELGPVLSGLLLTGRAGSATAAEIGAMVVSEQLDGLRMMSIEPLSLIVAPKVFAFTVVSPMLTSLFTLFGLVGSYVVGVGLMGLDAGIYSSSITSSVEFSEDVGICLVKSVVFGLLVGLIATYQGFHATRSAHGVSVATTSSVVLASVAILMADYLVTALWGIHR